MNILHNAATEVVLLGKLGGN